MPTPEENTFIVVPHHCLITENTGGPPYIWNAVNNVIILEQRRPASTTHPVRKDRTRALGSWGRTSSYFSSPPGIGKVVTNDGVYRMDFEGRLVHANSAWGVDLDPSSRLRYDCRRKALAQVTERTMQFSAALRQAKDTFGLVAKAANTFAHGLDNIMSGKRGLKKLAGSMSQWKKIPDKYLEYLYGWKPLADDVANAFDELSGLNKLGFEFQFTLKHQSSMVEQSTAPLAMLGYGFPCVINGQSKHWARVGYTFSIPPWYFDRLQPIAPFSTELELMPWSFVLDWFIPIGDMIGAMESMQFSPFFKEGFETYGRRDLFSGTPIIVAANVNKNVSFVGTNVTLSRFSMKREVTESLAGLVFSLPDLRNSLDLNKASQGLALLTQAFNRWR